MAAHTGSPPFHVTTTESPHAQIWRLQLGNLKKPSMNLLRSLTVPSEHARGRRYQFDADQRRHLAGRALVRVFMARRHDCSPRSISIHEDPDGKPYTDSMPGGEAPLHFNVAHTEGTVVAAFSLSQPVGVDVESLDRNADTDALARRVLTDSERAQWRTLPSKDRRSLFFQLWTCKEAFLKATGQGLRRPLRAIECQLDGSRVTGLRDARDFDASDPTSADGWALRPLPESNRIVGAVVRKRSLPASLPIIDAAPRLNQAFCA